MNPKFKLILNSVNKPKIPELVLDYRFTNNTLAVDRSSYHNNGVLSGGAVLKTDTLPFYVMDFTNPTSLITVPKTASINDISKITFRCWFYYNGAGAFNSGRLFDKSNRSLTVNSSLNRLEFAQFFTGNYVSCSSPNSGLSMGNWYCIQVMYDATSPANNPVIMIDGALVTATRFQTPTGTALSDSANDLILGNAVAGNRSLNGYESEVEIYNVMLTVVEGKRWYNSTCGKYKKTKI